MAIQRVSGNILQDNLQRGANLSIQGNLAYFDVTNNRVGILTSAPQDEFEVVGTANVSNVRITSATANSIFYAGATQLALTSSAFTFDGVNVFTSGNVQAIGNIEGGNIISDGAVIGNGKISGNLVVNNLTVNNTLLGNIISASGNVTGTNIISNAGIFGATVNVTGNASVGNLTITSATANRLLYTDTTNNVATTNNLTFDGTTLILTGIANVSSTMLVGNLYSTDVINAVGNITGANIVSNADISGATLGIAGNAAVGNILTDGYYFANGTPVDFQQPAGSNTEIQFNFNSDFGASANLTYDQATNIFQVGFGNNGIIQTDSLTVTGTIVGDDITAQGNLQVNGDTIVDGNLTVNGDLVYNNVTNLNIEDPIISMGRGANNTPLVSNDSKDRGEQLWFYNGIEKSAFIGYDNSAGNLIAAIDVSIANEIVTINQYGTWQTGNLYGQSALITGNVDAANISSTGNILVIGNVIAGNVISSGAVIGNVQITGNLTVANLTVTDYFLGNTVNISNTITALGNIQGGNLISNASVSAGTTISATGNITGGNVVSNAAISATTTVSATGNITGGNLVSNADISASNAVFANVNITGGNIISNGFASIATTVSATGNITGGNIVSNARIVGTTLDIYGDTLVAGNLTVQGNLTYINIDDLRVEDPVIQLGGGANGNALVTNDGKDRGTLLTYYATEPGNAFVGWNNSSGNMIIADDVSIANDIITVNAFGTFQAGNIYAESAVINGNVSFGNISTPGQISATGNITGGNLVSNANISAATAIFATGNITGGNVISNGFVSVATVVNATGNITAGNVVSNSAVSAATTISATGNITGGNIVSNALVTGANVQITTLTPNRVVYVGTDDYLVDSANFTFDGANLILLGRANIDNITIDGTTIVSNANVSIAATSGNILLTPGSTGVTQISSTTALTVPVGNTAQRPGYPDQGAMRFNSTNLVLEIWDGTKWVLVGQDLAILTSQIIDGDGSTVAFVLNKDTTAAGILVSVNGVSQIPDASYGVTGNVITFTEAPQVSDAVEVRFLTQITTVTEITNILGNAIVAVAATVSQVDITGNLLPTANVTYDLGSSSLRWKDGYFSGNSITLGNIVLKNTTGNTLAFFGPDGTTPATISAQNIDITNIANGTSNVQTLSSGTVNISAGGNANVVSVANGSVTVKADILNGQANGVGNIGSASTYFNTVFAKTTSAQHADLAEYFECDGSYDTGTVMIFARDTEVTRSLQYADQRLAGIVSTDPAFTMNSSQPDSVPIAMAGRVPCWVVGPVTKGDVLTTSSQAGHAELLKNSDWKPGVIVGKALESAPAGSHKIMVVVGAW